MPDGHAPKERRGSLTLRKSAPPRRLAPIRQREPGGGGSARSRRRQRPIETGPDSPAPLGGMHGAGRARAEAASFPVFGLSQALESVGALWPHMKATSAPGDTAVRWLGYQHLSPRAELRLAALRSYGLLEDGPTGIRLSQLAITIVRLRLDRQDGSSEYLRAVQAAALHPGVFRDVFGSHGHASYDALKTHLEHTLGFTGTTARKFIAVFRDTLRIARLRAGAAERDETSQATDEPHPVRGPSGHVRVFNWPLGQEVSAELRLAGDEITTAHLERLRQYVELVSSALEAEPSIPPTGAARPSLGKLVRLLPGHAAGPRKVRRSARARH